MDLDEFVRADSRNLPSLDAAATMIEYFQNSDKFKAAEIKGVKALMASRSGYVDNAVGYVEIRREDPDCIIKAKVVPEHKVSKKYYQVTVQLNEEENSIIDTTCDGCAASEGSFIHPGFFRQPGLFTYPGVSILLEAFVLKRVFPSCFVSYMLSLGLIISHTYHYNKT